MSRGTVRVRFRVKVRVRLGFRLGLELGICIFIMQSHYIRFMSIQIMRVVHK